MTKKTHSPGSANPRDALRLWLQLISLTTIIEKKIRNNFKTEFNSTLPRFDIMANLDRAGKAITMGELTENLLVSKGNVTGVVASLVDQGIVKRERDKKDRRTHYLSLTQKGRVEFAKQAQAHREWVGRYFSGMNGQDLAALVDKLAGLKETLTQNGKGNT